MARIGNLHPMEPGCSPRRPRHVRPLPFIALLIACVLGACAEDDARLATVTGTFRVSGGPAPGINEPLSGIIVFDGEGADIEVSVPQSGRFEVRLPGGDYKLSSAHSMCDHLSPKSTSVEAGEKVKLNVGCPIE